MIYRFRKIHYPIAWSMCSGCLMKFKLITIPFMIISFSWFGTTWLNHVVNFYFCKFWVFLNQNKNKNLTLIRQKWKFTYRFVSDSGPFRSPVGSVSNFQKFGLIIIKKGFFGSYFICKINLKQMRPITKIIYKSF